MKLRARNNSVRLRLTQAEVVAFAKNKAVEETIEFGLTPDKTLVYRLEQTADVNCKADFSNGKITISVPAEQAENWAKTNQIGIGFEQNLGTEKMLKILIEKDFACLSPRSGEDESDAFPHPEQGKEC